MKALLNSICPGYHCFPTAIKPDYFSVTILLTLQEKLISCRRLVMKS